MSPSSTCLHTQVPVSSVGIALRAILDATRCTELPELDQQASALQWPGLALVQVA